MILHWVAISRVCLIYLWSKKIFFKQTLCLRVLYSKPLSWWKSLHFPHNWVTELINFDIHECFCMCAWVGGAVATMCICKVLFKSPKWTGPYSKPQNYQSLLFYGLARELWHFLACENIVVGYFRAYRTIKTDGSI